ncbi:MAG TPA: response regulator [Polyangiaceae bacterium]|jgi:CheY-like chemotaxis protein|nr:response regulator [Polyangiaceae bacterium]
MDWEQNDYILVIEDDDSTVEGLTEMLQEHGHRVVAFDDGHLALDYLRQKSILPRVILLDSARPSVRGREFLAERRKDARLTTVPVVGISAGDNSQQQPVSSSLAQMLTRPVSLDAVLGVVQRWAPVEA